MSHQARTWALGCQISGPIKAVLLALAIRSDDDDKCWPSIDTVAADAGISRRCAQVSLRELEAMGVLSAEGMGGRRLTRMYRLVVGATPRAVEKRMHLKRERVHVTQERVHVTAQKGAPPAPEPYSEPSEEPSRNPVGAEVAAFALAPLGKPPVLVNGNLAAFEAWWLEYPAKRGGKDDARRAYAKAIQKPGVTHAGLLMALRIYPFDRKEFPRFIPHGSTWLNGGRYENAAEAAAPSLAPRSQAETRRQNLFSVGLMPGHSPPSVMAEVFAEEVAPWER